MPGRISPTGVNWVPPSFCTTFAPRGARRARPRTASRARARIMWSSVRPIRRKNSSDTEASKYACSRPVAVSYTLIAQVSRTPIEIGTSMLVWPWRSAFHAERKNGRPA